MELDIYIPTLKIAIEYDGAVWHKNEEHYKREVKKYKACKESGGSLRKQVNVTVATL